MVGAFGDPDAENFNLQTTGSFGQGGGSFVLACAAKALGVDAAWMKIVALKVGKLTVGATSSRPTTSGSGSPPAIHRWKTSEVSIGQPLQTVASMPISDGLWFVRASFTAEAPQPVGIPEAEVECLLDLDGITDAVEARLFQGVEMSQRMVALDVATPVSGGQAGASVELKCGSTQPAIIANVSIVAIQANTLLRRNMANGNQTTMGSGATRIRHGYRTDSVHVDDTLDSIGGVTLGAGRWLVIGKVLGMGANGYIGCGAYLNNTEVGSSSRPQPPLGSTLPILGIKSVDNPTMAKIKCNAHDGTATEPSAGFARLTAIKVAPLRR
jgi:hypothetical protein